MAKSQKNTKISKEQVLKVARLAKLNLSTEEVAKLSKQLTDTLEYIDVLDELNVENVSETFSVTGSENVYRNDVLTKGTLSKEEVLSNGSDVIKDMFGTDAVLERS